MKKVLKFFMIIILVIIVAASGWWAYHKFIVKADTRSALTVIPENAVFMASTNDLSEAWTVISESKVWEHLITNPYFSDINSDIELLNKFLAQNIAVDAVMSERDLLVSGHMTSGVDWDLIFVVDLKGISSMIRGTFRKSLELAEGFSVKTRDYKDKKIFELVSDSNPDEIIYLTLNDNLLVATFTGSLMERSIDGMDDEHFNKNKEFVSITNKLGTKDLFRFYLNYKYMQDFAESYLTEGSEMLEMIAQSLNYSAFDMTLEEELLSFDGYTGVDSIGSYLKALAEVSPGKMSAWRVASDQTSLYFSMGFDNYSDFYNNLIAQYKKGNAEDMEDIEKNVERIEKFLGISVEDHFFSWIGTEIAFLKLRPDENRRLEDVVVAIHANDIDDAKKGLGYITKKIKRRSPVKFEVIEYKNFEIEFLDRRNFFKLFFGKLFKDLEKPYFTYIEDFVVLSNSPEVLKSIIDDYITGRTLSNSSDFMDFKNEFSQKSNVTVFIRTPQIYQNLYVNSSAEDKKAIRENKEFIMSFANIGFQLVSEGSYFETTLRAKHNPDAVNIDRIELMEKGVSKASFRTFVDSMEFNTELPISVMEIDTFYSEKHLGTEKLKIEGRIKDGHKVGIWKSYYQSGNIESAVNYEEGLVAGEIYFFYDSPQKIRKAVVVYEDDQQIETYNEFHTNGARRLTMEYDDGKPDGDATYYFRTGKINIEGDYRDGQKHGRWKYYDEKGDKIGVERWKRGEKRKGFELF
ncbi:MAG: DUF3352 domain-containing protein [Bacteroidota bacterium]|nr:DUF3352 domain-containing protein [Bacteroidota bacterium]